MGFNSRTREGATFFEESHGGHIVVSIHAPVRVRQFIEPYAAFAVPVSIHAPVRVRLKALFSNA